MRVSPNNYKTLDSFSFTNFLVSRDLDGLYNLPLIFPEQVLVKRKKKTQGVAGIDQDELQDPTHLADPDSSFCEFNGVQLHHKICDAVEESSRSQYPHMVEEASSSQYPHFAKRVNFPMILLHGFGASVFSWNRVMKPLAQVVGSKVLAFDRPAFGLTSRINPVEHSSPVSQDTRTLNPYSMMFSVLATLYFIDFLKAEKAILVGYVAICIFRFVLIHTTKKKKYWYLT